MGRKSNYEKHPFISVPQDEAVYAVAGWEAIGREIQGAVQRLDKENAVICVDCYHGVFEQDVLCALQAVLKPDLVLETRCANKSKEAVRTMLQRNITDDRVFGVMSHHRIEEFFVPEAVAQLRQEAAKGRGMTLVFGVGASLCCQADLLIYADMARWEIQQRFRSGRMANWLDDQLELDTLRKFKRGFFVDWRVLDRHKRKLYDRMDYVLDTNAEKEPKLMTGDAFRRGLAIAAAQPFRVVPYFDPGVWGGQWMKEVCDLDRDQPNFAWSFDCVPEENSLLMQVGDVLLETPAINLVFRYPRQLLGEKVHARFGTEFPIRFDMLDTMSGGNLSLQVHPLTEYIQEAFGMHYTQDESYYILDAKEESQPRVYLGLKPGITPAALRAALEKAQETGELDAEQFVNAIPAHKHDHFLIPGGTVHCSGKDCMVLEISATPYIFTFKLWDWGRLGLDGKPRPVHLDHGMNNIQFDRDTQWVMENLVGQTEPLETVDGARAERTGLHSREFIETRRYWFDEPFTLDTEGGVNVLNLVEGEEAVVESPDGAFAPFTVHYAETFIVPAAVGKYSIRPQGQKTKKTLGVIRAYVRT